MTNGQPTDGQTGAEAAHSSVPVGLPLTPAMTATLEAHLTASLRVARVIAAALLLGGVALGALNVALLPGQVGTRFFAFCVGFLPLAALAFVFLYAGSRAAVRARADTTAGTYLRATGPVHLARQTTAAGFLQRGGAYTYAVYAPPTHTVTILNQPASLPLARDLPQATVAYAPMSHYVFAVLDVGGSVVYRDPRLGI